MDNPLMPTNTAPPPLAPVLSAALCCRPWPRTRSATDEVPREPQAVPSVEGGEITEKGYVNQRATLERRDELVKKIYVDAPGDDVIVIA